MPRGRNVAVSRIRSRRRRMSRRLLLRRIPARPLRPRLGRGDRFSLLSTALGACGECVFQPRLGLQQSLVERAFHLRSFNAVLPGGVPHIPCVFPTLVSRNHAAESSAFRRVARTPTGQVLPASRPEVDPRRALPETLPRASRTLGCDQLALPGREGAAPCRRSARPREGFRPVCGWP